jgi:phage terminase large subunit
MYIPNQEATNHALIEFGHCQHEHDVEQYLSAEYDRMSFDEMVTFSEHQYLMITSCLRTTIPGLVPRAGGATNPAGSALGLWVKRRWIDKDLTEDDDEDYRPDDYDYIPALPTDNPHLDWKQYMRVLNRLHPEIRAAYRDGSWDIFRGQFFTEFHNDRHVCEFTPAPKSVPRYGGLDWGWRSEGVHLWVCFHPDGHLDVEHEYVFNGPKRSKQVAKEVAQEIVARTQREGLQLRRVFGDPSMNEQRGHLSGETIMDTFKRQRVPVVRADNDRVNGWARLRAWLRDRPDGTPFLRIHPRCAYLTRTFGAVTMDDDVDGDLDTDGPDHALDTLRYIVMGRHQAPGEGVPAKPLPGTVGAMKLELLQMHARAGVLGLGNVRRRGSQVYQ